MKEEDLGSCAIDTLCGCNNASSHLSALQQAPQLSTVSSTDAKDIETFIEKRSCHRNRESFIEAISHPSRDAKMEDMGYNKARAIIFGWWMRSMIKIIDDIEVFELQ